MSQQIINLGLIPNDGSGDALRVGAQKINENFTELYERGIPEQAGNNGKVLTTSGTVLRWDRVTDITGNAATVTNGVYTTGSYNNPSWLTGLAPSKVLPNQSGNTGKYLTTDGATLSWVDLETVSVFDYNNLLNRPVFPDNTSDLVNDSGFITSSALTGYATETYVNSRGFITNNGLPSQSSNTGKYLTTDGTALSWGTVSYTSLTDKPTIPPTYTLPTATTSVLGGVKVDGTTVTITDGVISSVGDTALPTNSLGYLYNDGTGTLTWASGAGVLAGSYQFSVAADDSTQRVISTDEVIKFIGAGTVTTSSDAEGNITITGSGGGNANTGNFTFNANTIANNNNASIVVGGGSPIENIEVNAVDELVPPGGVWRLFIGDEAYPTLGATVQIGDTVTTSWGTPITATIVDIQQDNGNWQIHVDQDITAGHNDYDLVTFTPASSKTWTFGPDGSLQIPGGITGNNDINITVDNDDSSTYTWNFGQTGDLTAPGDITTGLDGVGGRFIQDCANGNTSMRWINVNQGSSNTQLIRAYTGDPKLNTEVERAQIKLNWDQTEDKSGLTIRTFDQTDPNNEVDHDWLFKGDGVLQLPVGGDIVDSNGVSVLSGLDANIWVQTFVSDTPTTDFPQIATSVEYDNNGNVIALFSHLQPNGAQPDTRYFSVGKYSATGTKLWTAKFADDLETDGWGLAVDNADGWIYVAGQTGGDVYTYDVSTLTKIDSGNGGVEWSKIYDFGFASSSAVVDVDSTGNPIMVGWANNGTDSYLTVTKINKLNGNVTWTRKLDGQTNEQAYGMAVGPTGEIVAVGTVDNLNYPEPYRTIVTLTATPTSDPDWTTDLLGVTSGGLTYDITFAGGVPTFSNIVDTDGNRYEGDLLVTFNASQLGPTGSTNMQVRVGTTTGEDMSDRMVVVKYASDGTIAWQKAIQFDEDYDCSGADADIDSNGNIYICGQFGITGGPFPGTGIALVKFDSTGVKQWSRRVTGDCVSSATSIVVGPDDKLYISGVNGDEIAETFTWVVAKYSLDGLVEWQRFIENTDSWTFAGGLFGPESGGSNIAVRQGYVALSGGFGAFDQQAYAAVLQIPDTGNVFAAGPWSVTVANLSGTLNGTASDIGVVNADLTDSDNALTVEPDSVTIQTEVGAFLIGTLYTAPGGENSLVNGVYSVILENTGTLTLPAGGTIKEGYVTSNPTIQLTPASPDVASQKLVIKGGGPNPLTTVVNNNIGLEWSDTTAIVGDTVYFNIVGSTTYANQTLYWWIHPENAGIGDSNFGTVAIDVNGAGAFSILIDSDDNEFTVRVSPENNNYDPDNLGVESYLINSQEPTYPDYHLHLTTGNLAETSIFLGTDDHNVRTTTAGNIEINTPGIVTVDGIVLQGTGYTDGSYTAQATTGGSGTGLTVDYLVNTNQVVTVTINQQGVGYNNGDVITIPGGSSSATVLLEVTANNVWEFGTDSAITFPDATVQTTAWTGIANALRSEDNINIDINLSDSTLRRWQFGEDGHLTLPGGGVIAEVGPGAIQITPTGGANEYQALMIYPTAGEGDHIHLTAGGGTTELYLGNDLQYVKLASDGNIRIQADNGVNGAAWTFGTDGSLQIPGDIRSEGNINIDINLADSTLRRWQFGEDGKLTFPDGTSQSTAWTGARTIVSAGTASLANAATGNLTITGYKGYALYKIQTSAAAWVRIYTDTASRTADAGRDELTDPTPGSGVIAEVITTGAETVLISPGAMGFSNESTPSTNIQLAVTNKSGGTTAITVTLTVVQLEA